MKPEQLVLTSVVSDRDMPFNTPCGQISVLCYLVRRTNSEFRHFRPR